MKLSEKIYYYRKKTGKSQEALAEQLGVSRQAVSKWETGESEPEIAKLKALAAAFGVTVDHLLSEEAPPEENARVHAAPEGGSRTQEMPHTEAPRRTGYAHRSILPLIRRWGWLSGVYVSLIGAGMMLVGGLASFLSTRVISHYEGAVDQMMGAFGAYSPSTSEIISDKIIEGFGSFVEVYEPAAPQITVFNPVGIVGGVILALGAIVCIGGIILAVWLKKKGKEQ